MILTELNFWCAHETVLVNIFEPFHTHKHVHERTHIDFLATNKRNYCARIYCCCRNSLCLHCFPSKWIFCMPPFLCMICTFTVYSKCAHTGNHTKFLSFLWILSNFFFLLFLWLHQMRTNEQCCISKKNHFNNVKWTKF